VKYRKYPTTSTAPVAKNSPSDFSKLIVCFLRNVYRIHIVLLVYRTDNSE
jgi:hypothetical protein